MVDVGVTQNHGVQGPGRERKGCPVPFVSFGTTLDHAAVQKETAGVGLDKVARPGHLVGGPMKCDVQQSTPFSGMLEPALILLS